jgi:hypothetical protein
MDYSPNTVESSKLGCLMAAEERFFKIVKIVYCRRGFESYQGNDGLKGRHVMRTVVMGIVVLLSTALLHVPAVAGPIHDAAKAGEAEQVEGLIAAGAAVDEKDVFDKTALHFAAENGRTGVARILVAKGADVNAKDFQNSTPLFAASQGYDEIVELLIGSGADVNQKDTVGSRPLDDAVRRGHKAIVEMLISAGAKCGTNHNYSMVCNRDVGQN